MELKQTLGKVEYFCITNKKSQLLVITFLNKIYKTVMSFNKPQKHEMSTERLALN